MTGSESVEYFDIKDDKVYDYVKENIVVQYDKPSWIKKKIHKLKAVGKNSGQEKVTQHQEKILIII